MRSVHAPRVPHDATVEFGTGARARAVNLSVGGIFVSSDHTLDPGEQLRLKVNLRDGAAPLDVAGEVVWKAARGMAVRFVGLDDDARLRIQHVVKRRESTSLGKREVRIHLPSLNAPLRATARDMSDRGVMVEAELPWLRLGSQVTTELSPERACDGRVQWIGLDVTRSGSARLRIFVDLAESAAGDPMLNVPPPEIAATLSSFVGERLLGRRRWLWPAVALSSLVALICVSTVLLARRPTPPVVLLPSAPPEKAAMAAHLPAQTTVPPEKSEAPASVPVVASASAAAALAQPARSAPQVTQPQPAPAPHKAVRAKARPKRRTTATRHAG